jgi:DNA (cytosine-5)-methyltransferase 1
MTLYFCHQNKAGYHTTLQRINLDICPCPCPCIMGGGIHGDNTSHYWLEDDYVIKTVMSTTKPLYHVPLMTEIAQIPWNGFSVCSLFAGTGGSCLGYRMAGYRVLWANEFVPAAQASYRVNAARGSILDGRDIRQVQPGEILQATGLQVGELDILDGSPPCQAFSTAGKREKGWGKNKTYEHGARQKNETLFTEYIRLLRGLNPKTFVAENVSGLVKGVAKGFFLEILREMKTSGYCVTCKLLDAQWLGVPQMRQRVIFVGVREDLG